MTYASRRLFPQSSYLAIIMGTVVVSIVCGYWIIQDIRVAILPVAILGLGFILLFPQVRIAFVVMGGIVTLQGEGGLSAPKLAYMAGSLICILVALYRYQARHDPRIKALLSPLTNWTWQWGIVLAMSLFVAISRNIDLVLWLRGAIPYLLFAATPIVVYDVASSMGRDRTFTMVLRVLIISGLLSSLSWFVSWTNSRGYADLPIDRLFLWSFCLSFGLYCYALSAAIHQPSHNAFWAALAVSVVAMFVLTGTRQSVLFAIPIIFLTVRGHVPTQVVAKTLLKLALPMFIVGGTLAYVAIGQIGLDGQTAVERFLNIGGVTSQDSEGLSYRERLQVSALAQDAFTSSPLVGVSPGHMYSWVTERGREKSGLSLDTPFALPASFGLLGVAVAVLTLHNLMRFLDRLRKETTFPALESDAIRSFMVFLIVYVVAGSPFEDKGLSFAFMLLISLAFIRSLHDSETGPSAPFRDFAA
jgi:hypothetical protein